MTDPELADATYIEPITPGDRRQDHREGARPDALLPTMGGQTALNTRTVAQPHGRAREFDVEMIGANADAIDKAEDRELFREAMTRIGLETPRSMLANATAAQGSRPQPPRGRARGSEGRGAGRRSTRRSMLWKPAGTSARATASSAT